MLRGWGPPPASTFLAAPLPSPRVEAASAQRVITPEKRCHGCECSQILSVTLPAAADCKVSSSLPKAFAENGQVGSRNTSKTLDPCPQVSGSARHAEFVSTMRSPCFHGDFLTAPSCHRQRTAG